MSWRWAAVRIGQAVLSMALLTLVIFGLVRLTGDPTNLLLPDLAPEEVREALREKLGLNEPLLVQYGIFLADLTRGDLGESFVFKIPVTELIAQRLPATVMLAVTSLVATLAVGIPLGVIAAYRRNGVVDKVASFLAILGQSAPGFWVALLLVLVFSIRLKWLPPSGRGDGPEYLILPVIVISLGPLAGLVRLLRSSMIEVLETDYVKFLRLKGLSERKILWQHALRNAGLTTLTFVGILTATLLTGSVVAETVFAWPGMGWLISESIISHDFAVVQGVVLIFSFIYIVTNLIVDLLYGVLNPRLR
jgi:peptide/nickel transport system permease protein